MESPSKQQSVTYTSLPYGNLKLKFRMYDSSLSEIVAERTLDILVVPPFWRTWWFYSIILIFVGGIVLFVLRSYVNHLKQLHTEDKMRFFTNTAHDIRTSLTLINAPIEELNKEKNLSKKGRYYLDLATEQSGRLSFVATQILDIQKVDIGKGQLFLTNTDIVQMVYRRKLMFDTAASKKGIKLQFVKNKDFYYSAVDEVKMEKIIDNLLSNAIKYSHPDGTVEISLVCNDKEWVLSVKDYGLGISENAQKKLFREFYRGDNTVNSKMVGSGIGLLLVKNYVVMHNGRVALASKEHEGSLFTITIPFNLLDESLSHATPPMKRASSIPTETDGIADEAILVDENKRAHLLLVEDNNDLVGFLNQTLSEYYNISVAHDGSEAWEQIQEKAPDLIISDVMMPKMDGFELCRLIKTTFETSHIPVILLTALSDRTHELEGIGIGADDYISKPFDMALLLQRIKSIVRNREAVKERALESFGKTNEGHEQKILPNEINDKFVKRAVEVVHEHMSDSAFGKEQFASEMCVSSSLLYKKLKSLTDRSPVDFIKEIRLKHAKTLLLSQQHTVTEVSELCGFASVGYFGKAFKKHFGKSPTELK